jgi:hypothetical protein
VSAQMTMSEALRWAFIRNIDPERLDEDVVHLSDAASVIASAATLLLIQRGQGSPAEFWALRDELRRILPAEFHNWKQARSSGITPAIVPRH